jgi:hypothetical protein
LELRRRKSEEGLDRIGNIAEAKESNSDVDRRKNTTQTTNDPQLELRRRKSEEGLDRIGNIAEAVLAHDREIYGPFLLKTTKESWIETTLMFGYDL